MKVLFIISDANCRGGTEVLAFHLLDRLNQEGHECWLLSRHPYHGAHSKVISVSAFEYTLLRKLSKNPINKLIGGYIYDLLFREVVKRIAKAYKIDWVINHTYDLINALPRSKSFKTAQIYNWSIKGYEASLQHSLNNKLGFRSFPSKMSLFLSQKCWRRGIYKVDYSIVLTNAAQKELLLLDKRVNSQRISIIPNPLNFDSPAKLISTLCNNKIVFVGRLSSEKGIMRMLRIWKIFQQLCPEYILYIYGEGNLITEVEDYIITNKLFNIKLEGYCKNLETIYRDADLCCMTSDTEGFGMVLIEAMYFGVPCISFDCPVSPKEIISNAGTTVPCFDESKYATLMANILSDKRVSKEYQRNALRQSDRYLMPNIIAHWNKFLAQNKC